METGTPVCNFCHYGQEVTDICGKLHVEIVGGEHVVAAHHKCMQYSAGLIQYKFDHFGGFKIDRVQSEVRRGKSLKCCICKYSKKRKGKTNQATSGCAVKTCRRSFHYYCAKKSDVCITKRMLVRYRQADQQMVLYRVFCSSAHEQHFKLHKEDLIKDKSSISGSSDSDDDDNDATSDKDDNDATYDKDDNDDEMTANSSGAKVVDLNKSDILMKTLFSPELNGEDLHPDDGKENEKEYDKSCSDIDNMDDDDDGDNGDAVCSQNSVNWFPSIMDVKSLNKGMTNTDNSKPTVVTKLFANELGTDQEEDDQSACSSGFDVSAGYGCDDVEAGNSKRAKGSKNRKKDQNITLRSVKNERPSKGIKRKETEPVVNTSEKVENDADDERGAKRRRRKAQVIEPNESAGNSNSNGKTPGSSSSSGGISPMDSCYADCVLVVPGTLSCEEGTKQDLIQQLNAKTQVLFWSKSEQYKHLTKEHMPHLMSDIVNLLSDDDFGEVVMLLTDDDYLRTHLQIHNYALKLHRSLEKTVVRMMQESFMSNLANTAARISSCKLLTADNGITAIAIFVDNRFDADNKLRSSLGLEEVCKLDVHKWASTGMPRLVRGSRNRREEESLKLTSWIRRTVGHPTEVIVYPNQPLLLEEEEMSVSNLVAVKLRSCTPSPATKAGVVPIVCILRVDQNVVNYRQLCQKCIQHFVRRRDITSRAVFVVDIMEDEFEDLNSMIPDDVKNFCNVSVFTANQPHQGTMSCLLLHVMPNASPQKAASRKDKNSNGREEVKNGHHGNGGTKKNEIINIRSTSRRSLTTTQSSGTRSPAKQKRVI